MFIKDLKNFLEKIDKYRDDVLFVFIKPFWPRKISPNHLTYLRIAIGLVIFATLFLFGVENKVLMISLFCIGALTDLFDGSVARCLNKVTELGTMLDPVADRILILPIAIYSLYGQQKWLLLFLLLAEVTGALASLFHKSKEVHVEPNIFGKTKTVVLSIVFVIILISWPNSPPVFWIDVLWFSLVLSALSIFTKMLELSKKGYIKNKTINEQLNKYNG